MGAMGVSAAGCAIEEDSDRSIAQHGLSSAQQPRKQRPESVDVH